MKEILNGYNNIFKMVGENLDDDVRIRNFSYDHYSRLNLSNEDSRKKKTAFDNKIKDYFSRLNDINHQHDTDRDFQNFEYYLRELNEKLIAAGYNEVKSAEDFFNLKKELAKKNNARNQPQNAQNNNASRSSAVPSGAQNGNNNPSRSNSSRTNASRSNTASSNASNGNQSNNTNNRTKKEKRKINVPKVIIMVIIGGALLAFPGYISVLPITMAPVKFLFGEASALKLAMLTQTALKVVGGLMLARSATLMMGREPLVSSITKKIKGIVKENRKKRKEKKLEKKILKSINKAKNKNNRSQNVTPDDLYQNTNSGPTNGNSRSNNATANPVTPEDLFPDARNNPVNRNTNTNAASSNPGVSNDQRTSAPNPGSAPTNGTQNTNTGATNPNPGVSNDQRASTPNPSSAPTNGSSSSNNDTTSPVTPEDLFQDAQNNPVNGNTNTNVANPNPGNSSRDRSARTGDGSTTNVSKNKRLKQLREEAEKIVGNIVKIAFGIQNPEVVANQKKYYSELREKVSEMEQLLRETGKINDPEYTTFLQAIGNILENNGIFNYNNDNSRSEDHDQTINMGRSM